MDKENNIPIRVKGISKIYKLYDSPAERLKEALSIGKKMRHLEYAALTDISFDVHKGETFGIIGTNGAGKSTLLKLITGVATPTAGNVEVNGKISALLELGAGFNNEYSGIENIYLNGVMMGFTREEMKTKVDNILEFADIGDFINQPVKTYSSGMFARLAFAVAINVEPDILIVDEALSVGDVFFQNKCYRKFEELRNKGTTVLFVSHDIGTVKQMCSRVLWIEHGITQMLGESVEVCNAYSNSLLAKRAKEYLENTKEEIVDSIETEYSMEEDFELEEYPAITYTNESILNDNVQIISCYMEDNKGQRITECNVNQEYKVVMLFKNMVEISPCIVGFVLETVKGLWIINSNSAINGEMRGFKVKAGSINKIEFRFVMPSIMNGDYVLGVAVSEGTAESYQVLTWLYHVLYVRINNDAKNSAVIDVKTDIKIYSKKE